MKKQSVEALINSIREHSTVTYEQAFAAGSQYQRYSLIFSKAKISKASGWPSRNFLENFTAVSFIQEVN